jgi:hypothetical protein
MDMQIDQAGRNDKSAAIEYLDIGVDTQSLPYCADSAILDQQIGDLIDFVGGIDHTAAAK